MNWGYKILFVYIAFVAGILFLVFKVSAEKDDLVTPDYYAKELKYQQRIDDTKRANALSGPVQYELKPGQLVISFPRDLAGKKLSGNILLYCPSDENKDINQPFDLQDTTVTLALPAGYKGLFELHIEWKAGGEEYYYEKKIFI